VLQVVVQALDHGNICEKILVIKLHLQAPDLVLLQSMMVYRWGCRSWTVVHMGTAKRCG
jgi:hypothetical protein